MGKGSRREGMGLVPASSKALILRSARSSDRDADCFHPLEQVTAIATPVPSFF
jgi:hypothetical protein